MGASRIGIIGHVTPTASEVRLPSSALQARNAVRMSNFTRVVTPDEMFVDHIAYLKRLKGIPASDPFSVWEMHLCAGLLLSSYLSNNGFEVKLVNYIDSDNEAGELSALRAFKPDIVVVSSTFVLSQGHLCSIGSRVRAEFPDAFIVAGGHHVHTTLMYMDDGQKADYLKSTQMDAFIEDSQGEGALLDLCRSFPDRVDTVANMTWRRPDNAIVFNAKKPERNDVNDTLIDPQFARPNTAVHIRTARSCTFKCAFCSYPTIAGSLALMEIDHVLTTIRKTKDAGAPALIFVDDTFNVPPERFEILLDRMIAEGLTMPWYSFLRCQYITEAVVEKMRRSGCEGVFLGVESGSDRILKAMKKGAIIRFYRNGVKWLREHGITTVGSFIIGFPTETAESVEETREFIDRSGLDYYFMQPFYYLHHTPVHKRAAEYGLTGNGLFWSHKTMNWSEALEHVNRLFLSIKGSTFINPDYNLWEIAYLRTKGMSFADINDYRQTINRMTAEQMVKYKIVKGHMTSRVA